MADEAAENAGNAAGSAAEKPVTAPAAPATMTLPTSEVEGYRTRLAAFEKAEAESKAAAESKERERLKAIAEKAESQKAVGELEGRYRKDLAEREERYEQLRTRYESRAKGVAAAGATTGVQWASEYAGRDALAKIEARLEVVEVDGQEVVRDRVSGRAADVVVKELLASPEFAHYQATTTKGKGGLGGGNAAAASGGNANAGPDPTNLGEFIAARMLAAQQDPANRFGPPGLTRRV